MGCVAGLVFAFHKKTDCICRCVHMCPKRASTRKKESNLQNVDAMECAETEAMLQFRIVAVQSSIRADLTSGELSNSRSDRDDQ